MLEIKVTLTADDTLTRLLTQLLEARPVSFPVPQVEEAEAPKPGKPKAPAKSKAPAAKKEVPQATEAPAGDGKSFTLEEVRAIAHEVSTTGPGGIDTVKAALRECGVKNLTALDPGQYSQFVNLIQDTK